MTTTTQPLSRPVGELLRQWRERRRLSQLDLALQAEVSTRHLSFVETGRSRPSRDMVLRLAEQLDVPLRERNHLLLAAGYAPVYRADGRSTPRRWRRSARRCARSWPATSRIRRWWSTGAGTWSTPTPPSAVLIGRVAPALLAPPVNVLRVSLHPDGMAPRIVNLGEWRAHLLGRLRRQIAPHRRPRAGRAATRSCAPTPATSRAGRRAARARATSSCRCGCATATASWRSSAPWPPSAPRWTSPSPSWPSSRSSPPTPRPGRPSATWSPAALPVSGPPGRLAATPPRRQRDRRPRGPTGHRGDPGHPEVDARFGGGGHDETPLHWAASSDDVEVLDALLDAGADIEAPGGVIGGGTPLADARAFGQWRAAHRLVERGARPPSTTRPPSACSTAWRPSSPAPPNRRRGQPRLLGRLPRRPAGLRRVPPGPGRRHRLGPPVGAPHAPGRGGPLRRRRPGRLAPRPGRQAGRRAARVGAVLPGRLGPSLCSAWFRGRLAGMLVAATSTGEVPMGDQPLTIGIEEEFQIVDRAGELKAHIEHPAGRGRSQSLGDRAQAPRCMQSVVEAGTQICADISEARRRGRCGCAGRSPRCSAGGGLRIASAGTHPFSHWQDQQVTEHERYRARSRTRCRTSSGELLIFGLHVHVGIDDREPRIEVMNEARYFLPHLLALSTSQPVLAGPQHRPEVVPQRHLVSASRAPASRRLRLLRRVRELRRAAGQDELHRRRQEDLVGPPAARRLPDARVPHLRRRPPGSTRPSASPP